MTYDGNLNIENAIKSANFTWTQKQYHFSTNFTIILIAPNSTKVSDHFSCRAILKLPFGQKYSNRMLLLHNAFQNKIMGVVGLT